MSSRPEAGYDALFVAGALSAFADGAAAVELHLFAYLACLLSIYDGRSPEEWGYSFVATPAGAPYAESLAEQTDSLRAAGMLLDDGPLLIVSERGREFQDSIVGFSFNRGRAPYLEASCSTATVLPLPTVAHSVAAEPGLQNALQASAPRELLGDTELILVDEQFAAITETLVSDARDNRDGGDDLLVPATVWLSYLDASSRLMA